MVYRTAQAPRREPPIELRPENPRANGGPYYMRLAALKANLNT